MSAQHTPGPWSVGGKYAYKTVLLNARGESIASGGNNRQVVGPELEASLRLAAAAPDLLEACQLIVSAFDALKPASAARCEPLQINAARAAIAKATGSPS